MKRLYLRGVPVSEILERLPGRTARQIWSKASRHKIRRPRLPQRLTGSEPVDTVRRRAFDLNMSMADLNTMAGNPLRLSTGCPSAPRYLSQLVVGFGRPDLHLRLQVIDFVDAGVLLANKNRAKRLL